MKLANKTIAITGASGFVGHYAARVALQRGAHVIAVLRNPDAGLQFSHPNLEIRAGDITNLASLERALNGAEALIHCAALISIGFKDKDDVVRTNETGTKNSFVAAAAGSVKRAVLVSSASVYKPKRDHYYLENDPLWPRRRFYLPHHLYGITKANSERIAARISKRYDMGLSIVRPQMIYGAYCREGFSVWLDRYCENRWPVDFAGWRFPTVYAGDLAEAMIRMLERDAAAGHAYNVANDPKAHTYDDHVAAWYAARGQSPHRTVAKVPLPFTRQYDIARAQQELQWSNRPLVDGYRETMLLQQGKEILHDPAASDIQP